MTYVKASVRRPSGNPGNGIQPKDQLVIYDVDDILSFPQRNDAGVVIEDDIVMKAGRYAIGIYLTPEKRTPKVIRLPLSSIIPVMNRKSASLRQTGFPKNVSLYSVIVAESLPI